MTAITNHDVFDRLVEEGHKSTTIEVIQATYKDMSGGTEIGFERAYRISDLFSVFWS